MAELKASIRIRTKDRASAALDKVVRESSKLEERLAGLRGELAALESKDSPIRDEECYASEALGPLTRCPRPPEHTLAWTKRVVLQQDLADDGHRMLVPTE